LEEISVQTQQQNEEGTKKEVPIGALKGSSVHRSAEKISPTKGVREGKPTASPHPIPAIQTKYERQVKLVEQNREHKKKTNEKKTRRWNETGDVRT